MLKFNNLYESIITITFIIIILSGLNDIFKYLNGEYVPTLDLALIVIVTFILIFLYIMKKRKKNINSDK